MNQADLRVRVAMALHAADCGCDTYQACSDKDEDPYYFMLAGAAMVVMLDYIEDSMAEMMTA